METRKGCTYWYQISMHVDKKGDGVHEATNVRIPVACISANTHSSIIKYLEPASACVESRVVENCHLFDSPFAATHSQRIQELESQLAESQREVSAMFTRKEVLLVLEACVQRLINESKKMTIEDNRSIKEWFDSTYPTT